MGEGRRGGYRAGAAAATPSRREHHVTDGRRRRQRLPYREPRLRVRVFVLRSTVLSVAVVIFFSADLFLVFPVTLIKVRVVDVII